jgi:hypothetical protein
VPESSFGLGGYNVKTKIAIGAAVASSMLLIGAGMGVVGARYKPVDCNRRGGREPDEEFPAPLSGPKKTQPVFHLPQRYL